MKVDRSSFRNFSLCSQNKTSNFPKLCCSSKSLSPFPVPGFLLVALGSGIQQGPACCTYVCTFASQLYILLLWDMLGAGVGNENIPSSLIIVSQFGNSSGLLFMQISLASSVPSISLPSRSPASALQTSACPHPSLTAYLAGHSDVPCTPAESLWLWSFSNAGPSMMLRHQPG